MKKSNDLIIQSPKRQLPSLSQLSIEQQQKIENAAIISLLVDEAKEKIKAESVYVEKYIKTWLTKQESRHTVIAYKRELANFVTYLGSTNIIMVDAEIADDYMAELKRDNYKSNSIRQKIGALSSFYNVLKRYKKIMANPFQGIELPKKFYKKSVSKVMDKKELARINKHIDKKLNEDDYKYKNSMRQLQIAIHFYSTYGLRLTEINNIEIVGRNLKVIGKGNKERFIPLQPISRKLYTQKIQMSKNTIQGLFKSITRKLGYKYSIHDLRHYFANEYYKQTKDIVKLKTLLGHASINVTDIYLQGLGCNKEK